MKAERKNEQDVDVPRDFGESSVSGDSLVVSAVGGGRRQHNRRSPSVQKGTHSSVTSRKRKGGEKLRSMYAWSAEVSHAHEKRLEAKDERRTCLKGTISQLKMCSISSFWPLTSPMTLEMIPKARRGDSVPLRVARPVSLADRPRERTLKCSPAHRANPHLPAVQLLDGTVEVDFREEVGEDVVELKDGREVLVDETGVLLRST